MWANRVRIYHWKRLLSTSRGVCCPGPFVCSYIAQKKGHNPINANFTHICTLSISKTSWIGVMLTSKKTIHWP